MTVPETVPLPDGTTWTDSTGREWTSHGDDVTFTYGTYDADEFKLEAEQVREADK